MREDEAMSILGVPDVVVRERVDIHVQVTIVVRVDVRNEAMSTAPSMPPPFDPPTGGLSGLYRIWDLEVHQYSAPTDYFLC